MALMKEHIFSENVHLLVHPDSIWHDRYTLCGRTIRRADIPAMQGFPLCKTCASLKAKRVPAWRVPA